MIKFYITKRAFGKILEHFILINANAIEKWKEKNENLDTQKSILISSYAEERR